MIIDSKLIEAHIFRKQESEIEFLLLKRSVDQLYPNIWQMVTGSIEQNEKAFQTALREIKEETGLMADKFWVVPNVNSFYSFQKDEMCLIPVFAAQVRNDAIVKLSDEHIEYRWVCKEEAQKLLAWPGQRKSVEIINEYFINQNSFFQFVEIDLTDKNL
jgi:dATP pyrophosphohydrolase